MKVKTKKRKKAIRGFKDIYGRQALIDRMYQIISKGKVGLEAGIRRFSFKITSIVFYLFQPSIIIFFSESLTTTSSNKRCYGIPFFRI